MKWEVHAVHEFEAKSKQGEELRGKSAADRIFCNFIWSARPVWEPFVAVEVWKLFVGDDGGRSKSLVFIILIHSETEFHWMTTSLFLADSGELRNRNRTFKQKNLRRMSAD